MGLRESIANLPSKGQDFRNKLNDLFLEIQRRGSDPLLEQLLVEIALESEQFDTMEGELCESLDLIDKASRGAETSSFKATLLNHLRSIRTIPMPTIE